jgi:hypothetical protein
MKVLRRKWLTAIFFLIFEAFGVFPTVEAGAIETP